MKSYAVKEMFVTLQGEGMNCGRRAIFIRFAGCNLWSGREEDRAGADCTFCDTDFVGTDGDHGGRYRHAAALAAKAAELWDDNLEQPVPRRFAVLTGGEPLLQVDSALVAALKAADFDLAIETNGTLAPPEGIDWICVSPKLGCEVVLRRGDELKLVWPQPGIDYRAMEDWDFPNLLVSPKDDIHFRANQIAAIKFVLRHPRWRLSTQTHKALGLR